jgi:hypothetical protein
MATKKVNIDIVARDKSKRALNKVRANLDGVKRSVFNLRNAFIGLGVGLAVRSLVNTGKSIENLQVRLKFLFGTAEEGAKAFDEMAKFASKVPFSLEEIQKGAGVLAVVSKDAKELAKNMELTGNVAAVTGLDFKTTAEQIQRSLSAGISAADLFRDRGVKAMLGFKAGATVSIEETVEAFERVFGSGGKFAGATDALAQTFEGTLSMIGDKIFNFKRSILEAGFFPELKKQFGDLNKFLEDESKLLDEMAISIGKGLAQAVKSLGSAIVFVKDNFAIFKAAIAGFIAFKFAGVVIGIVKVLRDMYKILVGTAALTGPRGLGLVAISFGAMAAAGVLLADEVAEVSNKFKDLSKSEIKEKIKEITAEIDNLSNANSALVKEKEKTFKSFEKEDEQLTDHQKNLKLLNLNAWENVKVFEETDKVIQENSSSMLQLKVDLDILGRALAGTTSEWIHAVEIMGAMHDAKIQAKADFQAMIDGLKAESKAIEDAKKHQMQIHFEYYLGLRRLQDQQNKKEAEDAQRSIIAHKQYGETRLLGIELDFQKEREIQQNNFHAMLDQTQAFVSAEAEMKKLAKEHIITESRST